MTESEEQSKLYREIEQHARELAPESETFEQFAEAFGFGNVCEWCGREGLDDEEYSDCQLISETANPADPPTLVCNQCIERSRHR